MLICRRRSIIENIYEPTKVPIVHTLQRLKGRRRELVATSRYISGTGRSRVESTVLQRSGASAVAVAMSFSPRHTTAFSVTDILSPIEESYKKTTIEASIPPLVPSYRGQAPGMGGGGGYHNYMPAMHHPAAGFQSQYCNGADLVHYADPAATLQARNNAAAAAAAAAGWYNSNPASDPRFASEYRQH